MHRKDATVAWKARALELHAAGVELDEIASRVERGRNYVRAVIAAARPSPEIRRDPHYPLRAIAAAADALDVPAEALRGPAQLRELVRGRWAVMVGMNRMGANNRRIGARLNRDASTVCTSLQRADHLLARDRDFAALVERVVSA